MGMAQLKHDFETTEAFLDWEETQEQRYEFVDGHIYAMVGARRIHIEVLSESTASYDRGRKFAAYRRITELEEYVLIDPEMRRIETYRRAGDDWLLATSEAPLGLVLKSLDFIAAPEAVFENL